MQQELVRQDDITKVPDYRKYLMLLQDTKRRYASPQQRMMVINTSLSFEVADGTLSENDRKTIMNFYRGLENR